MTGPGSIGHILKSAPGYDVMLGKIRELELAVRQLQTARTGNAMTVDGKPGITVTGGGAVQVVDADGHVVAVIGALPDSFNHADGSAQPGVAYYREDGSLAALLGDLNPTVPPYRQSLQLLDRAGNAVLADDTNSGRGLASPWVPLGQPMNTDVTVWPATTAATWTDIASCYVRKQNPGFMFSLYTQADAATTGGFRILLDGAVVATAPPVTGTFSMWTGSYYWPSGWVFGDVATLSVQAQRTSGTGTVRAAFFELMGVQSP